MAPHRLHLRRGGAAWQVPTSRGPHLAGGGGPQGPSPGAALIRGPEPPPRSCGRCRRTEGEGRGVRDPRAASAKKMGGAHQGGERAGPTDAEGRGVTGPGGAALFHAAPGGGGGGAVSELPQAYCLVSLSLEENRVLVFVQSKAFQRSGPRRGTEDRLRQMDNVRGAGGGGPPADSRVQTLQPRCHCGGGGGSPPLPQLPSQPARPPSPHYGCAPEFGTGQAPDNAGTAHRRPVGMLALSVALASGTAGWV